MSARMAQPLRQPLFAGLVWSFLVALLFTGAARLGLIPEAPDQWTYDWRTVLLSPRAKDTRSDIAVLLINEQSLTGYAYLSPIDRGLLADLVAAVDAAEPKAIGLDFIFDTPTEKPKDEALLAAIRAVRAPVVLGAIDERAGFGPESLAYQEAFLKRAARPAGHLYFANEKSAITIADQTVRFMVGSSPLPPSRPAFAELLAEVDGPKPKPATSYIAWLLPPERRGVPLFTTFTVPAHRDAEGHRAGEILPESWRQALYGKIVLIGGRFADRDEHLTPFSVSGAPRLPGVLIHAQILAQLRDGRSVFALALWQEAALLAAICGAGFFAAQRFGLRHHQWRDWLVALVVIVPVGLALFYLFRLVLPSATVVLAWPAGLFGGSLCDRALQARSGMTRPKRALHRQ